MKSSVIETFRHHEGCRSCGPAFCHSLRDLWECGDVSWRGLIPELVPGRGLRYAEPTGQAAANPVKQDPRNFQGIHPLSDDLLLIRTDLHGVSSMRHELDLCGLLYLHFRLDGLSEEEIPGCGRRRIERECFILSAKSRPGPWVRELVGDAWRTVGIVCRPPAFAQQDLQWLGDSLPEELRRFRAGEEIDFAFVGNLTGEMRSAVQSLMNMNMPQEIRNTYLRAKVVELVCLALASISGQQKAEMAAPVPVRLSSRDIEAIESARRFLLANSPAPPLGALARQVGVNRNKLAFGFKRLFGVTVGEFDRALRLERAYELLQRDQLPICHVANLAGYADPGSFSKAFKLEYGLLPSEMREPESKKVTAARLFGTPARHGDTR